MRKKVDCNSLYSLEHLLDFMNFKCIDFFRKKNSFTIVGDIEINGNVEFRTLIVHARFSLTDKEAI